MLYFKIRFNEHVENMALSRTLYTRGRLDVFDQEEGSVGGRGQLLLAGQEEMGESERNWANISAMTHSLYFQNIGITIE